MSDKQLGYRGVLADEYGNPIPLKMVDLGDGTFGLAVAVPAAAGAVAVSGPLTDAQLRAAAIAVDLEPGVDLTTNPATIAAAGSLSGAVDCGAGLFPVALVMPAVWTAADVTLQASVDGTNYADVYNADDSEYTVKAAASRFVVLDPADLAGVRYLKVRSGTSGTPVAQAAERTVGVVVRQV